MTAYTYRPDAPRTASNFRLLANPHQHYYTTRNQPILLAVMHITAGIDDYDGDDKSAEATVAYSASTSVKASYHGIVDSDSIIDCLPDSYTAWAQGVTGYSFNAPALSLEIGKATTDWTKAPAKWVEATLRNAAKWWAPRVKAHKIPLRVLTDRDEIQRLINAGTPVGFTEHWRLSPATRWDAGRVGSRTTFPWDQFFGYVREELGQAPATKPGPAPAPATKPAASGTPVLRRGSKGAAVKAVQSGLKKHFPAYAGRLVVDGDYGPATEAAVREFQRRSGIAADGVVGPATWRALGKYGIKP